MITFWTTSCVLFLAAAGALGTPTNANVPITTENVATLDRLATIEARLDSVVRKNAEQEKILESVLQKNAELEKRVEVLEVENEQLKEKVAFLRDTWDNKGGIVDMDVVADRQRLESDDKSRDDDQKVSPEDVPQDVKDNKQANVRCRKVQRQISLVPSDVFVGFTATISKGRIEHLGQAQTIIYDNTISNVGNAYHNHTGVFTAPITGVYVFNVDSMIETGDAEFLSLVKDGVSIVRSLGIATQETHYVTTSRTVVLQVSQGSEVWIRTMDSTNHGAGTIHGDHYSSFSGWLLAVMD